MPKKGTSSIEGFRRKKSKFENEHRDVKEMPEDWQKGHKKHTTKMTKDVKRKARDWKTTGVVSSIPSRAALPMRACSCTHSLSTIKHILSLPSQVFDFWSFPMFRPARPGTTCTKSARSLTAFITLQRGGSCKLIPQSPGAEANWAVSRCILRFNVLHLHWLSLIHTRSTDVEGWWWRNFGLRFSASASKFGSLSAKAARPAVTSPLRILCKRCTYSQGFLLH